jgi:hypothetical protein
VALLVVKVGVEQATVLSVPSPMRTQSDHTDVLLSQEERAEEQLSSECEDTPSLTTPLGAHFLRGGSKGTGPGSLCTHTGNKWGTTSCLPKPGLCSRGEKGGSSSWGNGRGEVGVPERCRYLGPCWAHASQTVPDSVGRNAAC